MLEFYECEGQMSIFDIMQPPQEFSEKKEISDICKFSGHKCNKENVWDVADTLDDKPKCPHICCRLCDIEICGARSVKKQLVRY